MRWHWKDVPIVGDFLTLPNACVAIVIAACANMLRARIEPNESGEAAAEAQAASEPAEAKLQDDPEYRETSAMVSEELAFSILTRVKDKAKQQKAKDFFNGAFLGVGKISSIEKSVEKSVGKISSIEKSVKKIEARVTNNEVKLRNNKVTKKAVGRAVQVLGGTVLALYYYGGWALVTKQVGLPIVLALFVYMTSRADLCESANDGFASQGA